MKLLPTIAGPADLKKLSVDQLPQLAAEVRQAICEQVARSGGHLAPNLGVVDLTIALHYVFDFGHDRLLWDVGHQCYTHKLLTGRQHLLGKLRQRGGMAGFPEPRESSYDLFSVGHAGTGISTAVGMARGDSLAGEGWSPENPAGRRTAVVIGDAERADARGGEVQGGRAPESARADHEHAGRGQFPLTLLADPGEHQLPAVAREGGGRQFGRGRHRAKDTAKDRVRK